MAFNTKEQEIIKYGLENGKSKEEVTTALSNYRLGITPTKSTTTPEQQSLSQRIGADIGNRVSNIRDIASKSGKSTFEGGDGSGISALSGGLQTAKQITGIASDVIGEGFKSIIGKKGEQAIGNIVKPIGEAVANTDVAKKYSEWAVAHPEASKNLESALGIALDAATIVPVARGVQAFTSGAKSAVSGAKDIITSVKENTTQYPTKIADFVSEKLTKLDPQVKNVLETANIEKFNNYVKVGEKAVADPRALTPLQVAGENVKTRILPAVKEDLSRIGAQKAKTLSSIATVQVKDATKESVDFIKNAVKTAKLTTEETKLVNSVLNELQIGKSPTISTLDKTVDLLQNTLYEKSKGLAIPVTSRVQSLVNQSIGKLNTTLKNAAQKALGSNEYSVLNDAYAQKITLFNKVNKLLGEEGTKGGAIMKRFFSPSDAGTKKLFEEIKNTYGIDLGEDATLAKFVMESLGDTRASSLLQQVPLSKGGAVSKALQYAEKKLTNPIKKARKIIEKRPQSQLLSQ